MSEPTITVNDFLNQSYQLISANTPTVPLHGNDQSIGLRTLNMLLRQYSANGLMITVEKEITYNLSVNQMFVTIGEPDYTPTPDITSEGRLVNLSNAWVLLNGVTYPLIDEKRTEFYSSYKYNPLAGLPRYIVVVPQTNLTTVQIFPSPSQLFELHIYGKFQLGALTLTDDLSELPTYYQMYLQFAVAKYLAAFKGRAEAWTPFLDEMYMTLRDDMIAASGTNLDVNINQESWLNGAWRVKAGV